MLFFLKFKILLFLLDNSWNLKHNCIALKKIIKIVIFSSSWSIFDKIIYGNQAQLYSFVTKHISIPFQKYTPWRVSKSPVYFKGVDTETVFFLLSPLKFIVVLGKELCNKYDTLSLWQFTIFIINYKNWRVTNIKSH